MSLCGIKGNSSDGNRAKQLGQSNWMDYAAERVVRSDEEGDARGKRTRWMRVVSGDTESN